MLEATIKDLERIAKHFIVNDNGCWMWQASKVRGYACTSLKGKNYRGHKLMYLIMRGDIPEGKVCDHLCRETACINPYHIEVVSQKENVNRGKLPRSVCLRGHSRLPDNLYIQKKTGIKFCLDCKRLLQREWKARIRSKNIQLTPNTANITQ